MPAWRPEINGTQNKHNPITKFPPRFTSSDCLVALSDALHIKRRIQKNDLYFYKSFLNSWELRDSNPRPSACKADALNQLS